MANIPVQVIVSAQDRASSEFRKVGDSISNLGDTMKRGSLVASGFLASLGFAGTQMLKIAGDIEQNRIAFETMTGSAEEARDILQQVSDFAVKTPFTLPEVVEASKQLMAMGASTEEVLPELKMLGDVAAGLGVPLERLILNFGQVRLQGKLTGRELRDFAIAGVPLIDELAKSMGVAKEEIADMVTAGEIGFDDVREAFQAMTTEGGKFENLMDKQSKSLQGIFSNISDEFIRTVSQIAGVSATGDIREGSFFDVVKRGAEAFLNALDKLAPKLIAFADYMSQNKTLLLAIGGALIGVVVVAIGGLLIAMAGGAKILLAFAAAGAAIAVVAYKIYEAFVWVRDFITETIIPMWQSLGEQFAAMGEVITNFVDSSLGYLREVFSLTAEEWATILGSMVGSILNWADQTNQAIQDQVNAAAELFKQWRENNSKQIELFASSTVSMMSAWKDNMSSQVKAFFELSKLFFEDKLNEWKTSIPQIWEHIEIKWTTAITNIKNAINTLRDAVQSVIDKIDSLKQKFAEGVSSGLSLPSFQTGGIVPGAIGTPQLVVAHGGEKVLPVGGGEPRGVQQSSAPTGNVTLNVQIGMYAGSEIEKRRIAEELWEEVGILARSFNKTPQQMLGYTT